MSESAAIGATVDDVDPALFEAWECKPVANTDPTGAVRPEMSLSELYKMRYDIDALNQFFDSFMRQLIDSVNEDLKNLTEDQALGFHCMVASQELNGTGKGAAINLYVDMVEQLSTNLRSVIAPEWVQENLETED